jgi:tetratricopeptide (TPR) repeat protein
LAQSLRFLRQTHAIYEQLVAVDPSDRMGGANLALADLSMAENLLRQNRVEEAMPLVRDGLAIFEKSNPAKGYWYADEMGAAYLDLGRAWALLAKRTQPDGDRTQLWRKALAADQKALAIRALVPTALDANGNDQLSEIRGQLTEADSALSRLRAVRPAQEATQNR